MALYEKEKRHKLCTQFEHYKADTLSYISTQIAKCNSCNSGSLKISFEINKVILYQLVCNHLLDVDILNLLDIDKTKPILIIFRLAGETNEVNIFLRPRRWDTILILRYNDDSDAIVSEYCHKFLVEQLIVGNSGILENVKNKKIIDIQDIGNEKNYNLLETAILENEQNVVEKLLEYKFDLNCRDGDGCLPIDKACQNILSSKNAEYKEKCESIILNLLLKGNSMFPANINYLTNTLIKIQKFVEDNEILHNYVRDDNPDIKELGSLISSKAKQLYYYNKENKSLSLTASEKKNKEIFQFLWNNEIIFAAYEIESVIRNFEGNNYQKSYIYILMAKSKVKHHDQNEDNYWEYIYEAYHEIDKLKKFSLILQTVAKCKTSIIFEINCDSVRNNNPKRLKLMKSKTFLNILHEFLHFTSAEVFKVDESTHNLSWMSGKQHGQLVVKINLLITESVWYTNVRSLKNKIPQIENFILNYEPKILMLSETRTVKKTNTSELEIPNYYLCKVDSKNRFTGGVACYIHKSVEIQDVFRFKEKNNWALGFRVRSGYVSDTFCVLYRSHKSKIPEFESFLFRICHQMLKNSRYIHLFGDFNYDFNNKKISLPILNKIKSFDLSQCISVPTREFNSSKTIIDWYLTNKKDIFVAVMNDRNIADHNFIVLDLIEHQHISRMSIEFL